MEFHISGDAVNIMQIQSDDMDSFGHRDGLELRMEYLSSTSVATGEDGGDLIPQSSEWG